MNQNIFIFAFSRRVLTTNLYSSAKAAKGPQCHQLRSLSNSYLQSLAVSQVPTCPQKLQNRPTCTFLFFLWVTRTSAPGGSLMHRPGNRISYLTFFFGVQVTKNIDSIFVMCWKIAVPWCSDWKLLIGYVSAIHICVHVCLIHICVHVHMCSCAPPLFFCARWQWMVPPFFFVGQCRPLDASARELAHTCDSMQSYMGQWRQLYSCATKIVLF